MAEKKKAGPLQRSLKICAMNLIVPALNARVAKSRSPVEPFFPLRDELQSQRWDETMGKCASPFFWARETSTPCIILIL